jgi:hypothetical protein
MLELQILLQRRRKIIARLALVALFGTAATLAILPRADAHAPAVATTDASLLSPHSLAGPRFSRLYLPHP